MRSQRVAAVISLGCFIVGAAIGLTASYGTRFAWWDYGTGLQILLPGFAFAVVGSLSGAIWIARALNINDSAGWRFGIVGLAGSLVVAFIPLNQLRLYLSSPPIHDITTDVEFAPPFSALLPLRAGAANGPEYDGMKLVEYDGRKTHVAAAQKKAYPDIRAIGELEKPSKLFWHGFEVAKQMPGWHVVAFDEKSGMIEAYVTSFWFGLTSDIAIRVKPAGSIGARLDIRSKSRTGENDMGMNAAIVRDYERAVLGR
ncbi:MAG TPA: DUF1499 domain-containing protein [Rhizomicrobium sp.]|nr:DUF1499 domain-containing protein [Rhizomicrobium sp.]